MYWGFHQNTLRNEEGFIDDIKDIGGPDVEDKLISSAIDEVNEGIDFIFVESEAIDPLSVDPVRSNYDQLLRTQDKMVGKILNAVNQAKSVTGDKWLVLVISDGGLNPKGRRLGEQSLGEKTTFIASNLPLNEEFSTPAAPVSLEEKYDGLYS